MVLIASMANNLDVISTIIMFKVIAMFPKSRCVGSIVFQKVARQNGYSHVFGRPDLKMSLGLTNVGAIAYTAREFI